MGLSGTVRRFATAAVAVALLGACGSVASIPGGGPSPSPTAQPTTAPSASPTVRPSPAHVPVPTPQLGRLIKISLSAQHLWVYEFGVVVVSTDVTTGMPDLPTPTGAFTILAKYSPYKFISPWPSGSPYYYDPLWVDYAMLFADGGYFIHDAWWQRNFGPGGNLKTGSHGCVNIPVGTMPSLYAWARIGDKVMVVS